MLTSVFDLNNVWNAVLNMNCEPDESVGEWDWNRLDCCLYSRCPVSSSWIRLTLFKNSVLLDSLMCESEVISKHITVISNNSSGNFSILFVCNSN